jgi:hypothetical protein
MNIFFLLFLFFSYHQAKMNLIIVLVALLKVASSQQIVTPVGTVIGNNNNFIGIKYADATRFDSPVLYKAPEIQATKFGFSCPQVIYAYIRYVEMLHHFVLVESPKIAYS